jgi:hypothetical protein
MNNTRFGEGRVRQSKRRKRLVKFSSILLFQRRTKELVKVNI